MAITLLAMLIALLGLMATVVQASPLAMSLTVDPLLNINATTDPKVISDLASTHLDTIEAVHRAQLSTLESPTAVPEGHLVARQTSVLAAALVPTNWNNMTPEAFCKSDYMVRSPENLLASDAISFYRNWTINLPPNPSKSEPEQFAQAMLGQDDFTCRIAEEGCTPHMDCPAVVRWLAADDGSIRNPERIRQVYFLTDIFDDIFRYWSYSVSEARLTTGMLGSLGTNFASTFFPQVSKSARDKCDKAKVRHKLAFTILFNGITVALGAGLGGPLGKGLAPLGGMWLKPVAEGGAKAVEASIVGGAISAALTNGIWAAVREPANAFTNRHVDRNDPTCHFPVFRDARIEDDAFFATSVKDMTDGYTAGIARYFDSAAEGTDKIMGQESELADYLDNSAGTFYTPNDVMQIKDSAIFSRKYEQSMFAGMVGLAWRLQHCYLHCVQNPNDACPIHEGSPVAHMEFCPEKEAKFCSAACWVPGSTQHRLYPLFGAFQQTDAGSGTWQDGGNQWFKYAGEGLKNGPWALDVPRAIAVSYDIRNDEARPDDIKDREVMGVKLSETSAPFMSIPVCDNYYPRSLPDYLKIDHDTMWNDGRGSEVTPCACGDDFGSGTFNFYNRSLAGVSEMRCSEDAHLISQNKDIIADYCRDQLKDDSKSIAAEWYANCNHVTARMSVRDPANVDVPLDLCAAGTQYFLGKRRAGDSDEQIDAAFCGMSFERGDANTPWFSRFSDLTRPNRLVLRSIKTQTERAMKRCDYEKREHWARRMKFEDDDAVCRWTGADKGQ